MSRDLSWLKFNDRVLDQAKKARRNVFEKMKFLAITSSNLDEFFMIRVGSLYNYIDYNKKRTDYSGLTLSPFRKLLFKSMNKFRSDQAEVYSQLIKPALKEYNLDIISCKELSEKETLLTKKYFSNIIFPMLTPMVYDNYHTFPTLTNLRLILGVVTRSAELAGINKKLSFVQIPGNLPRYFEIKRRGMVVFVPIEDIIRDNISSLFRNVEILSSMIFRITRNGDFTLDESEDIETNFLTELRQKLKTRKTGRVVRMEFKGDADDWVFRELKNHWRIDDFNLIQTSEEDQLDYTGLWQIINHENWCEKATGDIHTITPLNYPEQDESQDIFDILKNRDILLHHPYNSISSLIELLEKSASDPDTLAIKITIYRLAKNSRVSAALLKAAENGIHVSVLFELKARFDEENNIQEAQRLQKAGCFVIYGVSNLKTHTKLMMVVRKEGKNVTRYVHLASGNYNEATSKLYTDLGLLTTNPVLAEDVNEFFNVITGHSFPTKYKNLITAPREMRNRLSEMIDREIVNAQNGKKSGIVIKINSLQDQEIIDKLYEASQNGVPVKLIVRGICCLRPGREGLSENIQVKSIVGNYLEHSRVYYFYNNGQSRIYVGSADVMVRSFDRRMESLFKVDSAILKQQLVNLLSFNLRDQANSYEMNEFGEYVSLNTSENDFDLHKAFYNVSKDKIASVKLF